MALSQDDRITISEKMVDIPLENASIDLAKNQLEASKEQTEKKDNANKGILNGFTEKINPYQNELTSYDGNGRTELSEQDILDSANRIFQNPFFPNDPNTPLPSISDGVWKQFVPFALNKAIGKDYIEAYAPESKEQDLIDAVSSAISDIELLSDGTRSSGKECEVDTSGTCSGETPPGSGVDESTCLANGGSWTPNNGPDVYVSSTDAATGLSNLSTSLTNWKNWVLLTKGYNQDENSVDTDAGRQSENNISIDDIDNLISIIDTWSAYQDFDTSTSLPTGSGGAGCALFDAMTSADFQPSKLREQEILVIKNEITARQIYIDTRKAQVEANLGSITQDTATGEVTASSGFYGSRFSAIDLRINAMTGTANDLVSSDNGIKAQDEFKASNNRALDVYSGVISVTLFKAPAAGTNTIHVQDSSLFSVGDSVYIKATDQEELSGTIQEIDGTRVVLDIAVSKRYRQDIKSRMYKVL